MSFGGEPVSLDLYVLTGINMATVSRKQREIQQREALILGVARDMLVTEGYLGMTMDRIAAACEYSKGTIYNHFPNKEEVVAALAIQTMNRRSDLFARASTFGGKTRERMMAVGVSLELFVRLYPKDFRALSVIQASSIREKTSHERQHALQACDNRCMSIVTGILSGVGPARRAASLVPVEALRAD